jgi:hypothetical protein
MYIPPDNFKYTYYHIGQYLKTLSWTRRTLAHFFERYRVTKEEYDKWYENKHLKDNT